MKTKQIFIGTGTEGDKRFLQPEGICHTILSGGSTADREQALASLAESVSAAGIPVFLSDAGGKLSGLSASVPVTLWDLSGSSGLPFRTTVTELGPLLLSKLLGLSEKQQDLLRILIRIADEQGLLLIDTKDLKALINEVSENSDTYKKEYGTLNKQTLSAILNAVVSLETKGSEAYLFEPAVDVQDLLTAESGAAGRVHILDAREQVGEKTVYAVVLLFLLGELYENAPDPEEEGRVQLVLFLDEAQLFLAELDDALLVKLQQILEGLAAKGIAACLSVPKDTDQPEGLIAAVSQIYKLQDDGKILCLEVNRESEKMSIGLEQFELIQPRSSLRSLTAAERKELSEADPLHEKYKIPFDRDSAYEFLKRRGLEEEQSAKEEPAADTGVPEEDSEGESSEKSEDLEAMAKRAKRSAKSLSSTVAGTVGRQVGKSLGSNLGSFGETLGGNIGASLGRGIVNTLFKS